MVRMQVVKEAVSCDKTVVRDDLRVRLSAHTLKAVFSAWLPSSGKLPHYDLFLSYRWPPKNCVGPTDKDLVRQLLDRSTLYAIGADSRKVDVFLDTLRLEDGEHFRESFLEALVHSTVVVPVLSTTALHRMLTHKKDEVDNVLLEWICAIACKRLGLVQKVYPVVIGPWSEAEGVFLDMYAEGSLDRLSDEQPTATMSTAAQLLSTHGLALPKEVQVLTVRGVVQELNRFLGYLSWEQHRDVTGGPRMVRQCTEQLVHVLKSCSAAELPVETAVEETMLCVSESTAGTSALSAADVYVDCERAWTMLKIPAV